jgi:diguanylate cyclase (GGDEF)-like protein
MKNTIWMSVVSMILFDSDGKLAKQCSHLGVNSNQFPHLHFSNGAESFHPSLATLHTPLLGLFCPRLHQGLFSETIERPKSVVVIPLRRHHRLIGFLCLGSPDINRFVDTEAELFLLQGSIIAICLENVITQEKLKKICNTDALTGISNRRHLEEKLSKELSFAQRHNSALSCLFIDIDKFKRINDQLGHLAGDEILKELAKRIKNELRNYDCLARFGGEEFVLLLPGTETADATMMAERIRLAVSSKAFPLPGQEYCDVTISVGGVTLSGIKSDQSLADLTHFVLAQADLALYQAKENGRNQVVWAN